MPMLNFFQFLTMICQILPSYFPCNDMPSQFHQTERHDRDLQVIELQLGLQSAAIKRLESFEYQNKLARTIRIRVKRHKNLKEASIGTEYTSDRLRQRETKVQFTQFTKCHPAANRRTLINLTMKENTGIAVELLRS